MHIPKDDTQNHPFCRLQLVVLTYGRTLYLMTQQIKIQYESNELLSQRLRKRY